MQRADILKLNDGEAVELGEIYGVPVAAAELDFGRFTDALFSKSGLQYIVITLGERGAFAASREGVRVSRMGEGVDLVDVREAVTVRVVVFDGGKGLIQPLLRRDVCLAGCACRALGPTLAVAEVTRGRNQAIEVHAVAACAAARVTPASVVHARVRGPVRSAMFA